MQRRRRELLSLARQEPQSGDGDSTEQMWRKSFRFTEGVYSSPFRGRRAGVLLKESRTDQRANHGRSDGVLYHYALETVKLHLSFNPWMWNQIIVPPTHVRSKVFSFPNTFESEKRCIRNSRLKASREAFNGKIQCETHLSDLRWNNVLQYLTPSLHEV